MPASQSSQERYLASKTIETPPNAIPTALDIQDPSASNDSDHHHRAGASEDHHPSEARHSAVQSATASSTDDYISVSGSITDASGGEYVSNLETADPEDTSTVVWWYCGACHVWNDESIHPAVCGNCNGYRC